MHKQDASHTFFKDNSSICKKAKIFLHVYIDSAIIILWFEDK